MGLVYFFAATGIVVTAIGIYYVVKYPDVYFKKKNRTGRSF